MLGVADEEKTPEASAQIGNGRPWGAGLEVLQKTARVVEDGHALIEIAERGDTKPSSAEDVASGHRPTLANERQQCRLAGTVGTDDSDALRSDRRERDTAAPERRIGKLHVDVVERECDLA